MTAPAWTEWFEFEPNAVIIGGKRLPATFIHGLLHPKPEDGMWGSAWVPVESGLYVHFYASTGVGLPDPAPWRTEYVSSQMVEYAENKELDADDWSLCPHEDGNPRHYRRCRVGPAGVNYLAVDLGPSDKLTRQYSRSPEDAFDMLRWASTIFVDGVRPMTRQP